MYSNNHINYIYQLLQIWDINWLEEQKQLWEKLTKKILEWIELTNNEIDIVEFTVQLDIANIILDSVNTAINILESWNWN